MLRALFYSLVLLGLGWGAYRLYEIYRAGGLPEISERFEDTATLASVKAVFALHRDLAGRPISVRARDGRVNLTGEVSSAAEREEAERLARSVEGVREVDNLLAINPDLKSERGGGDRSLGERLDDAARSAKVRAALALHRELKELDLSVRVRERTAYLDGEVESTRQAELAAARARAVDGVDKVESSLRVRQAEAPDDLAERVEAALRQNEHLRPYRFTAREREDGLVLEGRVATGAERDLAELLAQRVAGERRVLNRIRLGHR